MTRTIDPSPPLADDLWRPGRWWRLPAPARTDWGPVGVVAAVLVAYNLAGELVPDWGYVPANLAVAAGLVWFALRRGATAGQLGLGKMGRGLAVGALVAAAVLALVVAAVAIPWTRAAFTDDRVVGESPGGLLYEVLVRIPFGTALFEEVAFRGVLFGLLVARTTPWRAATVSSLLFGLWHVLPTIEVLELNDLYSGSSLAFGGAVTGAVAVTAAAGFGFCWLRLRAGSVLAPVLAHAATNSIAFAAGWLVVDQGWV